ncbi:MAG TPA: EVE domain-containing protein [Alphaproteobacteria bacterium]|nr:EVE domain-containing protein [Alphaproteobacteria bacterium]
MAYWLMKSEPGAYSWDDLVRDGSTYWDGVRNYQATNNMKKMKKGEKAFLYHSVTEKQIVGVMEVTREYYPDHTDASGRFGMVDVKPLAPVTRFVTLAQIKTESKLEDLALVRQSRLSVLPIAATHWKILCKMAGMKT